MVPRPAIPRSLLVAGALIAVLLLGLFWVRATGGRQASAPTVRRASEESGAAELVAAVAPEEERRRAADPRGSGEGAEAPGEPPQDAPFHGLLVDAATGEPVPHARLEAGSLVAEVGADGRFTCDQPLAADVELVRFLDPHHGTHIRDVRREELEWTGSGWRAAIRIGPTYLLEIVDVENDELGGWVARLVEEQVDGSEVVGNPLAMHAVEPPFLRYDNPWEPNAPDSTFRVEVQNLEGTRAGRSASLATALGIHPEVVVIRIDRELSATSGRVVDERGESCERARVVVLPDPPRTSPVGSGQEPDGALSTETDGEGEFEVSGLVPGDYRFLARRRPGEPPLAWAVHLPAGLSRIPDFVVPGVPGGSVSGWLVNRSGERLSGPRHVRLRAIDGRQFETVNPSRSEPLYAAGRQVRLGKEARHVFRFDDVPFGEYELSVLSAHQRWSPASLRVAPPTADVEFVCADDGPTMSVIFEAFDAETGSALDGFLVQLQAGDLWNPDATDAVGGVFRHLPVDLAFRWTLHAPGYRAARGDQSDLETVEGARVGKVALERGWSARLRVIDVGLEYYLGDGPWRLIALEHPPVPGAEIWLDGELAGTSDRDGVVELSLDTEPRRIEIVAPGWRQVDSRGFAGGRILNDTRDVRIWLVPR